MTKTLFIYFIFSFILFIPSVSSQNEFILVGKKDVTTIPFTLKNNLILIPLTINNQEFRFILDTGVSKTLLFNIKANDSVTLNNRKKVKIKGLGANEYYNAIKSSNNFIRIKNLIHPKATIYLITEAQFDFSSRIGMDVHGIIGADLFKNFVVQINYIKEKIKFYKPNSFRLKRKKRWKEIPIQIVKDKPYITLKLKQPNQKINLLLDSGSGDALWLFENETIKTPAKYFEDYLGNGLSGEIHGKKAKLQDFFITDFHLKNVLTAYPDSTYVSYSNDRFTRNGIIGGNILKRFNVIFNYPKQKIYLKKNTKFKEPFYYNKTGLDISYNGKILVEEKKVNINGDDSNGNKTIELINIIRFAFKNSYVISGVKKGSSAENAGIQKGDILLKINSKDSYDFTLEEIIQKLSSNKQKVTLTISRNGIKYKFIVPLIDYL